MRFYSETDFIAEVDWCDHSASKSSACQNLIQIGAPEVC